MDGLAEFFVTFVRVPAEACFDALDIVEVDGEACRKAIGWNSPP
jgi:hypothetical protein